jgi:hypothetical protein
MENKYPLVNVYITMENHLIFNGQINYFYGHLQYFQWQTVSHYQRVILQKLCGVQRFTSGFID